MAKTVQKDSLVPPTAVLKMGVSESCDTKGIVCFRTDQFHAANKSPTLSPDSCDGGVQEGGERAISVSFSRQEGSFQNYGMGRGTECATWADKDSCLETDSSGKRNQQTLYYRVKRVHFPRFVPAPSGRACQATICAHVTLLLQPASCMLVGFMGKWLLEFLML